MANMKNLYLRAEFRDASARRPEINERFPL